MDKIIITRSALGLAAMQVCCEKNATDEEILEVCNTNNPSGTEQGWNIVLSSKEDADRVEMSGSAPVVCGVYPERLHKIILC